MDHGLWAMDHVLPQFSQFITSILLIFTLIMKKIFILLLSVASGLTVLAQPEQSAQETARGFMRSGDFDNAILVLKKAIQQDNKNLELQKDLALSYLYRRDFARALETIKPLLRSR